MKRRKFTTKFKTKVVIEALSERYTLAPLAERHQLHPNQISQWKNQFLQNAESVFDKGLKSPQQQADQEKDKLLKTIGEAQSGSGFFKGRLALRNLEEKRKMISKGHPKLSLIQQCFLGGDTPLRHLL